MKGFLKFSFSPLCLFIVSFVVLFFLLGLHKVLFLRPQSIHQWAQCDRASVAWNYYTGGYDFFHPRVNNIANGSGITGLEFPIIQYVVALFYGVFGFHEWIYRFLTLCICACGLFCTWRIAEHFTGSRPAASLVVFLFASSPLLAYYSISFIPDVYSMSFLMIAWFMLFIGRKKPSNLYLFLHGLFFALACLIKPTAAIYIPAFGLYYLKFFSNAGWKKSILNYAACSFSVLLITSCWYAYAFWLSETEHSGVFLLQSRPVNDLAQLLELGAMVRRLWLERVFNDYLLVMIGLFFLISIIFKGKKLPITTFMALASLPGTGFYIWQMGQQLPYHDYYSILLMPILFFALVSIAGLWPKGPVWLRVTLLLFLLPVLAIQFYDAKTHVRISHTKGSWKYGHVFFDDYFIGDGILTRAGLSKEEAVLSVFDPTPNVSLYLMGRKGINVPGQSELEAILKRPEDIKVNYLLYHEKSLDGLTPLDTTLFSLSEVRYEAPFRLYRINKTQVNTVKE